jgi:hypothetical protein
MLAPLIAECRAEEASKYDRHHWAGSPAASSTTGSRPNAPSNSRSGWGSVNAAAAELGTAWLSLRKGFTRHGLGMPARNDGRLRRHA